jgi:hypothetical protein
VPGARKAPPIPRVHGFPRCTSPRLTGRSGFVNDGKGGLTSSGVEARLAVGPREDEVSGHEVDIFGHGSRSPDVEVAVSGHEVDLSGHGLDVSGTRTVGRRRRGPSPAAAGSG